MAHNLYWERAHGPIPEGLELDHLCRVPACVNPAHMEPVTRRENLRRRPRRHKLTAAEVRLILASPESGAELGRQLGVSRTAINAIRRGRSWVDITGGMQ